MRVFLVVACLTSIVLSGSIAFAADPKEFSFVDANGIRFAYIDEGTGPLVLLLHGYPETARSWANVQLRLAAAGYRVVAPNMRGYAPTSAPAAGDYMVGGLGADALALIDALGHEQAVVVGHDWGASAALAAATAAPDKVRGLVTIAIPHPLGIAGDPSVLLKASHFVYYQLPGIRWWVARDNFAHIDRIYQSWSPTFDWSSHDLTDIKTTLAAEGGLDHALGYYWAFGETDPHGRAKASPDTPISVPSLVIAGEADGALELSHFDTARPAFTGPYQFVALPDIGHFPQIEAPDATAEAILTFLHGLPPSD